MNAMIEICITLAGWHYEPGALGTREMMALQMK